MDEGSKVSIVRQLSKANTEVPLPKEQQFEKRKNHVPPNFKVYGRTKLHPGMQAWVEVSDDREGMVLGEPKDQLYNKLLCRVGMGIADVRQSEPFHILVSNFEYYAVHLLPCQVVAYASQHPESLMESKIMHAEVLSLISDEIIIKFRKRDGKPKAGVIEPPMSV